MDQKKIGSFLRELRTEKGLTQEQLAEHLNVAGRTVSRWENGNNMPDLSIVVELADFYDVDIRELLNGERKSENMNKDLKETGLQMASYAEAEKEAISKKMIVLSITGLLALLTGLVLNGFNLSDTSEILQCIEGVCYGSVLGAFIANILCATGVMTKIRHNPQSVKVANVFKVVGLLMMAVSFIACVILSLK